MNTAGGNSIKRNYYIFSNGRLLRKQNTVYLHQYEGDREDDDAASLSDAAEQKDCVLEDIEASVRDGEIEPENGGRAQLDVQRTSDNEIGITDPLVEVESEDMTSPGSPRANGGAPAAEAVVEVLNPEALQAEDAPRRILNKRPVPIEDVEAFYLFGETDLNTKLLNFLARHKVPLHVFNYYGFYSGSFMPRQEVNSGYLLVKQVEHYALLKKRLVLAQALVDGASFNILKNLRYYGSSSRGRDLSVVISAIENERTKIAGANNIAALMGIEGTIRALYYGAWPQILTAPWAEFTKRVRRPPDNPVNALVSFGNSLCYTLALGEIYRTPLSPLISFLHEPGDRRYSLSLDLAEIFKPILCDRLIFKLINNGELQPKHFDEKLNFCYLKESGRKLLLQGWDERLKQTIEHRGLGRKVSYRRLVRLECYRLKKHLMGIEPYQPFKIWW